MINFNDKEINFSQKYNDLDLKTLANRQRNKKRGAAAASVDKTAVESLEKPTEKR